MKVLLADRLSEDAVTALEAMGLKVENRPELKAEDLPTSLGDAEILVVRSTKVTHAALKSAPNLSLVVRAGAGVNTIDVAEASARGIYVANCPGKNTAAVAELVIGLMVAADRRIVDATASLRNGHWRKKEFGSARGLKDRALGIIGLGQIGQAVAQRAQGLEMRVVAWSRSLTQERADLLGMEAASSPEDVARQADAVTVHLAASPETEHCIGAAFFDALKPGAIFINTSRGKIVDTVALRAAIEEKGLRVALDVFEDEPAGSDASFEDVALAAAVTACTPHVGASTDQAAEAVAAEVVRIVRTYRATGRPPNTVNLAAHTAARFGLSVRHFNRVGVLARVLDALKGEGINVQEVENTIFQEGRAAFATFSLDQRPSDALLQSLDATETILAVRLNRLRA